MSTNPPTASPPRFALTGDLPVGTTVLEASAGTGKTFTIAGLAVRWVAETDLRLPDLLVVTFTRAATSELRDRVRTLLVGAADHLEAVLAGAGPADDDPVLDHLARADRDVLATRLARVRRALSDVDVATIATIHGFCHDVLHGLGIGSDLDRGAELVDDLDEVVEEVVDDLLVTTWYDRDDLPRLARGELLELARTVVDNPATELVPTLPSDPVARLRVELAGQVRAAVDRRARELRLLSYDDLLTRLDATLAHADHGPAARLALRRRYRVVLIDEFQDTDPVQWSIVSRAFADPGGPNGPVGPDGAGGPDDAEGRALVLIGDPKQAIYAFRGADVHAYLRAVDAAAELRTLDTNWRSDARLLDAFAGLFGGATFGHPDIAFREVAPAPTHTSDGLDHASTALRLRVVPRHESLPQRYDGEPVTAAVRELVAADLATDVVRLLGAGSELVDHDDGGNERKRRPLVPGDVAVLVRAHHEAALVRDTLRARGVPAVTGGSSSVFLAPAATDWQRLLAAVERPAASSRVRALALSSWIGWTADEVAGADETAWDQLHADVHRWGRLLEQHGVAALFRTISLERDVPRRLLGLEGGERAMADLEHLSELLHAAVSAEGLGPAGLATWFGEQVADAAADDSEERLRRLGTDDDAVQVLTIHGAKGLEFPVVYCPYLWSSSTSEDRVPVFHDEQSVRLVDVGGKTGPDHDDHVAAAQREQQGEELRLLYVALTRARHRVVAWYARAGKPEWSGLGRMLLCRDIAGSPATEQPVPDLDDPAILQRVRAVAARAPEAITVEEVPARPESVTWAPPPTPATPLERARFTRTLDDAWRRTSYTALTHAGDDEPWAATEPEEQVKDDEPAPDDLAVPARADDLGALGEVALPLADMPGGARVGTFVHEVLEVTDFAADDLGDVLRANVEEGRRRRRVDVDVEQVVAGLVAALDTPLGATVDGLALRGLAMRDRRDELRFEMPLDAGGGRGSGGGSGGSGGGRPPTLGDLTDLMARHLPATDPLAAYPSRVGPGLADRPLRGFVSGAIDLVLRRHGDDGPVLHVVDYKTNWLGTPDQPLTAWHYRPEAMAEAMMASHYPVQALLYAVALHRLLRWRLPGEDPSRRLGSVLYLFLRGMTGPDAPQVDGQPVGVFAWTPPAELVAAASDLLHGTRP